MTVFSNTTPFIALSSIDRLYLLPELFDHINVATFMAEYLGLKVVGTLGILVKAKKLGIISSFRQEVTGMMESGIHYSPQLVEILCGQLGE